MRWDLHRFRPPIVRDWPGPVKASLTPHSAALTGPRQSLNSLRLWKAKRDLSRSSC
jgi:hypothetical protein